METKNETPNTHGERIYLNYGWPGAQIVGEKVQESDFRRERELVTMILEASLRKTDQDNSDAA